MDKHKKMRPVRHRKQKKCMDCNGDIKYPKFNSLCDRCIAKQ